MPASTWILVILVIALIGFSYLEVKLPLRGSDPQPEDTDAEQGWQ
jgi:hypothetical protein